jgi:Cu-Zn family superoxide dismutase
MHKIGLAVVALVASVGIAQAAPAPPPQAVGVLRTADGTPIGNVIVTDAPDGGVFVSGAVKGVPQGDHGITVREAGDCTPFADAGTSIVNGLPPVTVDADGIGEFEMKVTGVQVASLLDSNSSAVIVTAFGDEAQKAACAVLNKVPVPAALPAGPTSLSAPFVTPAGATAGTVTLTEQADGTVRVQVQASGLAPGEHAMHFHQFGQCAPTFAAAGEHTNPLNRTHGLEDPTGPHAGDLPNITIGTDGTGTFDGTTNLVTISPSDTTLRDTDGTAVIIHALPDDGVTDPGGRANGRLLCAIVQQITVPLPDTGAGMQSWALLSMAAAAAVAGGTVLRRAAQR